MGVLYENRVNELLLWRRSSLSFLPHFHDSVEIIYMLCGTIRAVIDGKEFFLKKNSVCIALPNVIHAYDNEENIDAYSLIIPRTYLDAYIPILDTNTVTFPVIQFEDNENPLLALIEKIIAVNKTAHPFRKQILHGYFSILFGELFARTGLSECKKSSQETERRIITYCLENFRSEISLDLLAKALYISKNHISYIFSSKLKICLPDFLGALRVAEAKRLIERGASMTEAALESGFTSIRSFNRRFLLETGMTPREYAKSLSKAL